jgi:hypothetical protein
MQLKPRIYEIELPDTDVKLYLRNPSTDDFGAFVKKLGAYTRAGDVFASVGSANPLEVSDEMKQDMKDVVMIIAHIVGEDGKLRPILMEEVNQLTIMDCLGIVKAVQDLIQPKDPIPAAAK